MISRLYSIMIFTVTAILISTMFQISNTYQQEYSSATGLQIIVRVNTNSDNPDTTPVIMVIRDSQTFGIAESLLIVDDSSVATSEVVFQFIEGAIQNGQEFFACAVFLENNEI